MSICVLIECLSGDYIDFYMFVLVVIGGDYLLAWNC
jgi:hypothetical protein